MRRVPEERAGRLDVGRDPGDRVLDRLELRDRLAELLARERVGHVEVDQLAGRAEGIRRQQHARRVEQAPGRGLVAAQQRSRRPREVHRRDRARAVDAFHGLDAHALALRVDPGESSALQPDQETIRLTRRGHDRLRSGDPIALDLRGPFPRSEAEGTLLERDRRDLRAVGEARQDRLALRRIGDERDAERRERVTEEGTRHGELPEQLGHEREVEQLHARAALLLGHDQPRDPHLDEPRPERRVVPRARVEELPQARRRALVLGEAPHRLLEQLLLLAQSEIHRPLHVPFGWARILALRIAGWSPRIAAGGSAAADRGSDSRDALDAHDRGARVDRVRRASTGRGAVTRDPHLPEGAQ